MKELKMKELKTADMGAQVLIGDLDTDDYTVQVSIDNEWFTADDLRETAKFLKKEAKRLEKLTTTKEL